MFSSDVNMQPLKQVKEMLDMLDAGKTPPLLSNVVRLDIYWQNL